MKKQHRKALAFSLFSEGTLIIIISLVTLLLQLISFATTWNGAKIYLEDIFPYASLLFAVAIQATAYFFSNSLRGKINILKVLALGLAMCCSTYYSYIGIYNSVNAPAIYLQENYNRISQHLERIYLEESEQLIASSQAAINTASSLIISEYTVLLSEQENIQNCRTALSEITLSYTSGLRAPKQSAYENYEDYAAAYQIYINSATQGKGAENQSSREQVLAAYGYTSMEQLNEAEQKNTAAINALMYRTDSTTAVTSAISELTSQLTAAINDTTMGQPLTSHNISRLNLLFQAASLCGYDGLSLSRLTTSLDQCARIAGDALLAKYEELIATLPGGHITDANTMDLKASMDAQIMTALMKLNTILPQDEQLSYTNQAYLITDLYLVPIQALQQMDTRMTALFCLGVAALIDTLSVLFALSLRKKAPLWKRRLLLPYNMDDYEHLIYASLPDPFSPIPSLANFLQGFRPSPLTETEGYMLQREAKDLAGFQTLAALLCQLNLAKFIPPGFLDNDVELLLLKARFVFWANTKIYEERSMQYE